MQRQEKTQPETGSDDEKTQKARMLISLLGADFTRSATHPFFRRLSQTAIGKSTDLDSGSQTDVSGALSELLRALNETEPKTPQKPVAAPAAPKSQIVTKHPARPSPVPVDEVTPDPLHNQHPAIIARELKSMPQHEKTKFIKTLSGRLARQVALYSKEMG